MAMYASGPILPPARKISITSATIGGIYLTLEATSAEIRDDETI
jgi:hypothetical protein